MAIDVPQRSQSLHWRLYADDLCGKPVLNWIVHRMRQMSVDALMEMDVADAQMAPILRGDFERWGG